MVFAPGEFVTVRGSAGDREGVVAHRTGATSYGVTYLDEEGKGPESTASHRIFGHKNGVVPDLLGTVGWGGMQNLAPGEDVIACKQDGVWEPAVTVECRAPGVYRVQFYDGAVRDLPATSLSKSPLVDFEQSRMSREKHGDGPCLIL
eukprot:CAMPEP_0178382996 /NCGR_PEP_ID=MMETSP0689_2-20121128/6777_1 /TAXON_ID=160604 /ORGANISM="Amphidinium massartii, Strain CS-259" /LENGTH=146 /DNA_ID=CAMNT_0020003209 /DNA_START=265 /DNA_END=705 /DNA_ORIENTATION=+